MQTYKFFGFLLCGFIGIAHADLGIMTDPSEISAKNGAASIGITDIYDHPNQVPNGKMYVPVEYNRTSAEGNGTEHDPNVAGSTKNDIDYISLDQLKGVKGDQGLNGLNGSKGDKGDKGDKGVIDQAVLNTINNSISNETNARISNDTIIQKNIDAANQRVGHVEDRVSDLERTKVILDGSLRLADGKHLSIYFFDAYNWFDRRNDSFGIRFVAKLGHSYEETLIEHQQEEMRHLRLMLLRLSERMDNSHAGL